MKKITLKHKEKEYSLRFNRRSIQALETLGFKADETEATPISMMFKLFHGSFLANHPKIKKEDIETIFEEIPNIMGLVEKISELYATTIENLADNKDNEETKNVLWEIVN